MRTNNFVHNRLVLSSLPALHYWSVMAKILKHNFRRERLFNPAETTSGDNKQKRYSYCLTKFFSNLTCLCPFSEILSKCSPVSSLLPDYYLTCRHLYPGLGNQAFFWTEALQLGPILDMSRSPPSTGNVTPVTKEASSDARKAMQRATSSGLPMRPMA